MELSDLTAVLKSSNLGFAALLLTLSLSVHAAAPCPSLNIYDGTTYKKKDPEIGEYLKPITVIYGHKLYPGRQKHEGMPPLDFASQHVLQELVPGSEIIVYDVEHWHIRGNYRKPWKRTASVKKYEEFLKIASSWNQKFRIGLYGFFPLNDYTGIVEGPGTQRYEWWLEDNEATDQLSKHVDVVFPSLYTYNNDFEEWKRVALDKLRLAKEMNPDKPIIPFVWPQYYDHGPAPEALQTKFLPSSLWVKQLEFLSDHAVAIVIWGGFDFAKSRHFFWDNEAKWWISTKEFIMTRRACVTNP